MSCHQEASCPPVATVRSPSSVCLSPRADWSAGTTDLPVRAATQESFTASGEFICLQGWDAEEGAAGKRRTSSMCTKVNIHNARCCPSASSVRYRGMGGGGYTGRSVWDSVQDHFRFFVCDVEKCLSSALLKQRFYKTSSKPDAPDAQKSSGDLLGLAFRKGFLPTFLASQHVWEGGVGTFVK